MALYGQNCSGNFPEFGAIFMSNRRTKREFLERQIFGLPLQYVDFVKNVRVGMASFLFEHEERELHCVFEAISVGGVDIVPHAYHSSGRAFPAQVQFRVMWKCDPLPERCFQHAIKGNYYAAHKFSFDLSREQVNRLLLLFDVRRVGPQRSLEEETVKKGTPDLWIKKAFQLNLATRLWPINSIVPLENFNQLMHKCLIISQETHL